MSTGIVNCSAALRFSVLTPHIVRVEYSPTFIFEDRATLTFLRRTFDSAPKYTPDDVKPGTRRSSLVIACGSLATATSHRLSVFF